MTADGSVTRSPTDRTWLVAGAACLWGLSALMREPLAVQMPAATIVFFEHLLIVVCLLPWLPGALRAVWSASARVKLAAIVVGGGSSALATMLFTSAFALGDPVTPQVLQQLQPVFAMVFAALLLGERITRRFPLFALPALIGAWLMAFAEPFGVTVDSAAAAALAAGAACLWAGGTVLGRFAQRELSAPHITTLRFFFGLVAAAVIAQSTGAGLAFSPWTARNVVLLVLLALIPGLLGLAVYYVGLRATPATRATLAELAFPLTAAVVGVGILGAELVWSQWIGFVLVLAAVTSLALHERHSRRPAVLLKNDRPEAMAAGGR